MHQLLRRWPSDVDKADGLQARLLFKPEGRGRRPELALLGAYVTPSDLKDLNGL